MDNPTEQELRAFVGRKADYYLSRWQDALDGTGGGFRFNFLAFLFGGLWLGYRKMYLATTIFLGIVLVETFVEDFVFILILDQPETPDFVNLLTTILAGFVCGAFANRWYLAHARKVITAVRRLGLPEDAHLEMLSKRGGTSIVPSVGIFIVYLVVLYSCVIVVNLLLENFWLPEPLDDLGNDLEW